MAAHDHDDFPPGIFDGYRRGRILEDRRSGEERRDAVETDAFRVKWPVIVQVIGWVVGLFIIYNALTNRIAVVETRVDTMRSDISEMKSDVKTLLLRGTK